MGGFGGTPCRSVLAGTLGEKGATETVRADWSRTRRAKWSGLRLWFAPIEEGQAGVRRLHEVARGHRFAVGDLGADHRVTTAGLQYRRGPQDGGPMVRDCRFDRGGSPVVVGVDRPVPGAAHGFGDTSTVNSSPRGPHDHRLIRFPCRRTCVPQAVPGGWPGPLRAGVPQPTAARPSRAAALGGTHGTKIRAPPRAPPPDPHLCTTG